MAARSDFFARQFPASDRENERSYSAQQQQLKTEDNLSRQSFRGNSSIPMNKRYSQPTKHKKREGGRSFSESEDEEEAGGYDSDDKDVGSWTAARSTTNKADLQIQRKRYSQSKPLNNSIKLEGIMQQPVLLRITSTESTNSNMRVQGGFMINRKATTAITAVASSFRTSSEDIFPNSKQFSFEDFMDRVGTEDWYQLRTLSYFTMLWFVVGWFIVSRDFFFQQVKFIDYTGVSSNSKIEDLCNAGVLSMKEASLLTMPNQFLSISMEFSLYCDNEVYRQILGFSQSVFGILGYIVFGYISDNYGRRHALKLAWKLFALGQIILISTFVLPLVITGYILSSFAALAVLIIQISLINEQTSKRWCVRWLLSLTNCLLCLPLAGMVRICSGVGLMIAASVSQLIFSGIAFIIHNWRVIGFVCGVVPTICLGMMTDLYEESPRYLYMRKKVTALRLLNKIAEINSKPQLNIDLERSSWSEESRDIHRKYRDLFRYISLRICILAGSIIFFATEMLCKAAQIAMHEDLLNTYEIYSTLALADAVAAALPRNEIKRTLLTTLSLQYSSSSRWGARNT